MLMTPIRATYLAQALSVTMITLSMGLGYLAYQRDMWWTMAFNTAILCVHAGLFLWQGYIRARIRKCIRDMQSRSHRAPPAA